MNQKKSKSYVLYLTPKSKYWNAKRTFKYSDRSLKKLLAKFNKIYDRRKQDRYPWSCFHILEISLPTCQVETVLFISID